jgi:hypothetical protein
MGRMNMRKTVEKHDMGRMGRMGLIVHLEPLKQEECSR